MIPRSGQPLKAASRQISSKASRQSNVSIASSLDVLPSSLSSLSHASTTATSPASSSTSASSAQNPPAMTTRPPLAVLPLSMVLRSIMVSSISSSSILLRPSMWIMSKLAHARSPLLNPDQNPMLRLFLKKTFYKHFCAGENQSEVVRTVGEIKDVGFRGVILAYAKEVVLSAEEKKALMAREITHDEDCIKNEVEPWKNGTLETVALAQAGDFVALKFTGAGRQALVALAKNQAPPPALKDAIDAICELAAARGVGVLFDAEQQAVQAGIDAWTIEYMRRFNNRTPGKAVIYGTYQAYLKATPKIIAEHLSIARTDGFTLGVKLVRGAYIGSDPRHLIHDTKEHTDAAYDGIAEALMRRQYNATVQPVSEAEMSAFPPVNVVLASHNLNSVRKAQALRAEQKQRGESPIDLVYAQLQGMADDVSCELVQCAREQTAAAEAAAETLKAQKIVEKEIPQAYKYLVWGSTGECMKYLLRRAQENKDAMQRTRDGRNAMLGELVRRVKSPFA